MTTEEMLKQTEYNLAFCKGTLPYDKDRVTFDAVDYYANAISLIEKQIPKKPIDKERCRYCPSCGEDEFYLMYDNMLDKGNRYNYCCNCGQKLDWSDYE